MVKSQFFVGELQKIADILPLQDHLTPTRAGVGFVPSSSPCLGTLLILPGLIEMAAWSKETGNAADAKTATSSDLDYDTRLANLQAALAKGPKLVLYKDPNSDAHWHLGTSCGEPFSRFMPDTDDVDTLVQHSDLDAAIDTAFAKTFEQLLNAQPATNEDHSSPPSTDDASSASQYGSMVEESKVLHKKHSERAQTLQPTLLRLLPLAVSKRCKQQLQRQHKNKKKKLLRAGRPQSHMVELKWANDFAGVDCDGKPKYHGFPLEFSLNLQEANENWQNVPTWYADVCPDRMVLLEQDQISPPASLWRASTANGKLEPCVYVRKEDGGRQHPRERPAKRRKKQKKFAYQIGDICKYATRGRMHTDEWEWVILAAHTTAFDKLTYTLKACGTAFENVYKAKTSKGYQSFVAHDDKNLSFLRREGAADAASPSDDEWPTSEDASTDASDSDHGDCTSEDAAGSAPEKFSHSKKKALILLMQNMVSRAVVFSS